MDLDLKLLLREALLGDKLAAEKLGIECGRHGVGWYGEALPRVITRRGEAPYYLYVRGRKRTGAIEMVYVSGAGVWISRYLVQRKKGGGELSFDKAFNVAQQYLGLALPTEREWELARADARAERFTNHEHRVNGHGFSVAGREAVAAFRVVYRLF